jgi:hypothetical protein
LNERYNEVDGERCEQGNDNDLQTRLRYREMEMIHPLNITKGETAQAEETLRLIRALSIRERGEMVAAVCRAAAKIHAGRIASGLPPSEPTPWPDSTWALLKRLTANAKRT